MSSGWVGLGWVGLGWVGWEGRKERKENGKRVGLSRCSSGILILIKINAIGLRFLEQKVSRSVEMALSRWVWCGDGDDAK